MAVRLPGLRPRPAPRPPLCSRAGPQRGPSSRATEVSAAPALGPTVSLSPVRCTPQSSGSPPWDVVTPYKSLAVSAQSQRFGGRLSSFPTPDSQRLNRPGLGLSSWTLELSWQWPSLSNAERMAVAPSPPHSQDLWSRCVGISGALVPLVACHSTLSPESSLPPRVDEGRESGDMPLRWGSEEGVRLIGNWYKVGKGSLVEPFHLLLTRVPSQLLGLRLKQSPRLCTGFFKSRILTHCVRYLGQF